MRALGIALVLVLVLVLAGCPRPGTGTGSGTGTATGANAGAWLADLDALVSGLATKHKNLYFKRSRAQLLAKKAQIARALAKRDGAQAALSLAELVAFVGDPHTRLELPRMARLPLALYWFDDGVTIIAAAEAHADMVGARLLSIGGKPIDELLRGASAFLPADNVAGRKLEAPRYVVLAPLLRRLGALAAGADKARVVVKSGDSERAVEVATARDARSVRWRRVKMARTPLRDQKPRFVYWNTYLADKNTVYLRYRSCTQMRGNPMTRFAPGMLRFIDMKKVARVIVDLRGNGGGNSRVLRPLVNGLAARRARLALRVLIDRAVFSSALLNAIELRQLAGAKLVGEPTSGKPNHYGELRSFRLPRSGLRVFYSTKFFKKVDGDPATLSPDVTVGVRSAELLAGKDPALEAALSH